MKIYTNGVDPMTKVAATPILSKNPSKIFLSYQWMDFNETWYVVFGPSLFILVMILS